MRVSAQCLSFRKRHKRGKTIRNLFITKWLVLSSLLVLSGAGQHRGVAVPEQVPLLFAQSESKTEGEVKYVLRAPGFQATIGKDGAALEADGSRFRMRFAGSNPAVSTTGLDESPARANFLIGKSPETWITGAAVWGSLRQVGLYQGIDASYFGQKGSLITQFEVQPGADAGAIRMTFEGAAAAVDADGTLTVISNGGRLEFHAPVATQSIDGRTARVSVNFKTLADDAVGFEIGNYDAAHALTIGMEQVIETTAPPVWAERGSDRYLAASVPAFEGTGSDVMVAHLDASGNPQYLAFLGGSADDQSKGLAVDGQGNVYVAGTSRSTDFPAAETVGAAWTGETHAYAFKLNAQGSALMISAHWGGKGRDEANAIAVDENGEVYIAGRTTSPDFPVTAGAVQPAYGGNGDAFAVRLNAEGTSFIYATYMGGKASTALSLKPAMANSTRRRAPVLLKMCRM